MKKRIVSLLMTVVMILSLLPTTALAAGTYTDTNGHWAEEAIDRWSGYGVIQGNNGKFNPGNNLTRAHMATILSRLLNLPAAEDAGFKDVKASDWYADAINKCAAAGIMLGNDGYANPNAAITRQQAVVMLARALCMEPKAQADLSGYTDAGQVSAYAAGYLAAMAEAGIVKGTTATTLSPLSNINRAATVTILDRSITAYVNQAGEYDLNKLDTTGIVLVASGAVKLSGEAKGTLFIAQGAAGSTLSLADVSVKGKVLIGADNVSLTNVAAGVAVSVADGVENAKVNGKAVEAADDSGAASFGGSSASGGSTNAPTETPENAVTATQSVQVSAGKVKNEVAIEVNDSEVKATVPAGVAVENGKTQLTLTVVEKSSTDSNISVNKDEESAKSYDVHIDGVSKDNIQAIIVELGVILSEGMNMGNVKLYHVEDGAANLMTQVLDKAELDAHNEFYYDPATGNVTVAMATFSEVALVAETQKAWKGEFDYSWYDASKTELTIANADQLAAFGAIVGGMNGQTADNFAGKTVKLIADINLGDDEKNNNSDIIFYPIGYYYNGDSSAPSSTVYSFEGTFDGNGHKIANFYQNTWEIKGDYDGNYYSDAMGLFGYVVNGTVKNLTVDNFSSDGEYTPTGVIAAYAVNSTFENIAITNCNPRVYNTGNGGIVGIGGNSDDPDTYKLIFTNITIDNSNTITALWGSWDVACGGLVGMFRGAGHVDMTNCHVAAQIDVYNDVCGNYQYYWYRYSGMMVGTNKNMTTDANGYTVPETSKFHAENCTVHFGEWNDYYYCELVANSLASYTHDHQFSRLEQIQNVSEIQDANGNWTKTGNFIVMNGKTPTDTCYHIVNKDGVLTQHKHEDAGTETVNGETVLKENNQRIYLPFNQLFTGYGWGVKHIPVYNGENYAFEGITILDRKEANSVEKFEGKVEELDNNRTYKLSDIFTFVDNGVELVADALTVAITNKDESNPVSAEIKYDTNNWENGTITFTGTGEITITIQDYYFCTPTTIEVEVVDRQPEEKFEAKTLAEQDAYTQITFGTLFGEKESAQIGNVTASITVDEAVVATVTGTGEDWATKTIDLTKDGEWKVSICDDDEYCLATEVSFTVNKVDKFIKKFDKDFLYRVGNNKTTPVALTSLFDEIETPVKLSSVNVEITNTAGDAAGTFTSNAPWFNGAIQFSGTGVVKVTISAPGANDLTLTLEVVDAYNRTTASFSGNSVLLNDVSTSSTLSTSGIIYGNGFTVNMENAPISEKNGAVFHLYDGAILKNLGIVGKEFTTVAMNVNDINYGVSAVRAWGTVTIENCYISGCRSAVSVTGNELTIKDSVIANGVYANVDFRSGILNLHNVTTVNEPHIVNGTTIVGLGIVGNMTASAGRQLNITGNLTQYNWVSQADCENIKASGVNSIFKSVFEDSNYASLRYTYNGTTYVNTGILSLCSDFGASAATGVPNNYAGMDVTATVANVSVDGYVWAPAQNGTLTADDMKYHDAEYMWTANEQGTSFIAPAFKFENAGLTTENGVVQIEYESGSSYTLTADKVKSLFDAKKYGKDLSYTMTMDGVDHTDKDIVFEATESKNYTITYTVTDELVYDKSGKLTDKTYEVTKDLKVFATVVDKGADAPTFTFYYGTNGKASAENPHTTQPTNSYESTIKQIGEAYYIMPNVNATSANAIGSKTVDGTTVYYPIVDGINVRSGSSNDYDFTRYYPVFKAVKISDNGTEYSYSGTKEMPETVAWVSAEIDSGNGASALNDGFGLYNNQYLCKIQKKAGNAESGGTSVVKYSYTALDGNTYYYYVGYRFYDEDEGGLCVTPDTLITLADGSKVRVDSLTGQEDLLVWNHSTGVFDTAPVAYIVNHNERNGEYEVITLGFADGSEVNIIGEHVFYDATLGKYVALDAEAVAYIGHSFVKADADYEALETVELVSVEKEMRETSLYEVVSYKHLTCFTNDVISTSAFLDPLLNIFDIDGETFSYDPAKVQQDIETYGLYTYEDFEGLISEEAFELYNGAYLKVAIGKGYITWEDIQDLIDIYFDVEVEPISN